MSSRSPSFTFLILCITILSKAVLGLSSNSTNTTSCVPQTYPIPSGITTRNTFKIQVRSPGAQWQSLSVYQASLAETNITTGSFLTHLSSVAIFDFCDQVEVSVTHNNGTINNARIRPDSYGTTPRVLGNTITFMLSSPKNLVIQVNDDIFDCLHLLSNTPDTNAPTGNSTNVIYFGPGIHTPFNKTLNVTSGQTVYLAGGAVLAASVNFLNVSNASIRGRGVLQGTPSAAILVDNSTSISISGITVLNPQGYTVTAGQTTDLTIHSLRSFSNIGWGDGIDIFCSSNVLISNVFMRNSDDCIAIYAHRYYWYGNVSNITVENSSLWADAAHPINVGTHGNTAAPETISDLVFRNIDVLDHREYQVNYQGCIALNPGDGNLVENVFAENIRVEDFRQGQLVNMRVAYNTKYNTSPGRGIRNVTIRDMAYRGTHANLAVMTGYDEERRIQFVRFENLTVNGLVVSDTMRKPTWFLTSDFVPMYANEHVLNLTFTG